MSRTRQRTPAQTRAAFIEQLHFLAVSIGAYDSAYEPEAKRMATILATMFKNIGGKSLVEQLGMKNLNLPVSVMYTVLDKQLIAKLTLDIDRPWVDIVEPLQPAIPLNDWMAAPVLRSPNVNVSRIQLISALRNQEGGGHFVPSFKNDETRDFIENGGLPIFRTDQGIVLSTDGSGRGLHIVRNTPPAGSMPPLPREKISNAHFAAMRTMVTEVVFGLVETSFKTDVLRIFHPLFYGGSEKRHEEKNYVAVSNTESISQLED